jgi:acetyl-CoA carboxylase, biotin carboxylase subunit
MPDDLRTELHRSAVALASSLNYRNAGTVEFLFDVARKEFYFIEVNARIQVEHPVSEMISGFDLVQEQIRIAGGATLSVTQDQVQLAGHAIECRINAEDPSNNFLPSPGVISGWIPPEGEGVRLDTHMAQGAVISPFYDSMIGKLIVHAPTRDLAVARMTAALDAFVIEGVPTTLSLHRGIVRHPDFASNHFHTRWLETTFLPEAAR